VLAGALTRNEDLLRVPAQNYQVVMRWWQIRNLATTMMQYSRFPQEREDCRRRIAAIDRELASLGLVLFAPDPELRSPDFADL
jgi:hypothetical protein